MLLTLLSLLISRQVHILISRFAVLFLTGNICAMTAVGCESIHLHRLVCGSSDKVTKPLDCRWWVQILVLDVVP